MKKLLLFAAVAGLTLVSASPPDKGPEPGHREARTEARHDYPPCTRHRQDRCNQLRGHQRRAHAQARHRDHAPVARAARSSRAVAQRVRRAGERG